MSSTAMSLFREVFSHDALFARPSSDVNRPPLVYTLAGDEAARVGILVGPNASGKSFVRKLLGSACKPLGLELIHLSMQGRCSGENRIMRMFVYGNEDGDSTGCNTIQTTFGSFRTSRKRDTPHVLFYDEPETGLSPEYTAGLAGLFVEFLSAPPPHLVAAFFVSHRAELLGPIARLPHAFASLGTASAFDTYAAWASRPIEALDPSLLPDENRANYVKIRRALDAMP